MYSQTNSQVLSADGKVLFRQVTINGILCWQASTGRTFPQVAGAEDPPSGDQNGSNNSDPPSTDGDAGDEFDKDRALATIRKLRENERATKAQLKEMEDLRQKVRAHEDSQKTEAERLQARLAELEKAQAEHEEERRLWRDERALDEAARKFNARNPAVVVKLIDRSKLERASDGMPTNAEDLVKTLLHDEPYLTGKAEPTNGVPSTPRPSAPQGHDDKVKDNIRKLAASGNYDPL